MNVRMLVAVGLAVIAIAVGTVVQSAPAPKEKPEPKDPDEVAVESLQLKGLAAVAARTKSMNNLKQMAISFHAYNDAYATLPQNICDKEGKPLLSWRVHLLPFMEQVNLYQQFKLDEPWNSKDNLALLEKMPEFFENPRVKVKKKGFTVYQGFVGNGTIFEGKPLAIQNIPDGTSNTILLVESSVAVPWTKPVDLPFDPKKELPNFGKAYSGKPLAAMCDASARTLDLNKIKAETLRAALTTNGGEVLGQDWDQ